MQLYAERLLTLAFTDQNASVASIERQLKEFFIDGLAHDYLGMKVRRENPGTLQAAGTSAMNEQNLWKRFNFRVGKVNTNGRVDPLESDP